jgi:hypothetical protein
MQPGQQQRQMQPSGVASKYGDGPQVWAQVPNQIPIQQGMPMGGFYPQTQAVTALVLSILGVVGCGICTAVPGLILANGALQVTNSMPGHPDAQTAKAAQIVGWIAIGIFIVGGLLYALAIGVFMATDTGGV